MLDYITIGSVPAAEPCAQVGEADYKEKSLKECSRFIRQLEKEFGEPPANTKLQTKAFNHDFGVYHEVVCYFDDTNDEAQEYCYTIEANMPEYWSD